MPKECAFALCHNLHQKGSNLTFHSFPKDPQRRARWGYLMRREEWWSPKPWDVVCSEHFCPEDFDRTGQTVRLRPDVEPKVFDLPQHLQKNIKTRQTTTAKRALDTPDQQVESQEEPTAASVIPDIISIMPRCCAVVGCNSKFVKGSGVTFLSFPLRNKKLLAQWIKATGREDWQPTSSSRLCSKHFEEKYFTESNERRNLLPGAVPTIFDFTMSVKKAESGPLVDAGELVKHIKQEEDTDKKGTKRKRSIAEEQNAFAATTSPLKTSKRSCKLTPKALELQMENSSRSTRLKKAGKRSDVSSRKERMKWSVINEETVEDDETDVDDFDEIQSLVNILDVKRKLAASLENIKKKLASNAAGRNKKPLKRKKMADSPPLDKHALSLEEAVVGSTDIVIKQEVVDYDDPPIPPSSKMLGSDTITKLPNDFIHVKFATPRKQFIMKLTPKSDSTAIKSENLEDLLNSLQQKKLITSEGLELMSAFGELPSLLRKKKYIHPTPLSRRTCPVEIIKFSTMLYLCSPEAYNVVSDIYSLPDKELIQAGLVSYDFWPGFTEEALNILKNKNMGSKLERECSIMVDSVFIKRQHDFESSSGRWIGHVDFAGRLDFEDVRDVPLASEVLVFTAVGLVKEWKLPFGYFLNKGLSGELLKNLVEEAIVVLEKTGLRVKAVVCSGSNNFLRMVRLFGCNIHPRMKYSEIVTTFPHPLDEEQKRRIFIIFGINHFLKSLLHLMEDKRSIRSTAYGRIDWKFFDLIFSSAAVKKLTHLTLPHVNQLKFHELQRCVSLCNMNFSTELSNVLELAEESEIEEFVGCENAACFAADIAGAIDLLNSRNPIATEEKTPIRRSTMQEQLVSMKDIGERLCNLELPTGERIIRSSRWACVAYFAFTLKSVSTIASELMIAADTVNDKTLKNFCTYRLNLDHLDIILSKLQRLGGWNGIPSAAEFRNAYKELFEGYSEKTFDGYDFEGEDLTVGQGVIYSPRNILTSSTCKNGFLLKSHYLLDLTTDLTKKAEYVIQHLSERLSCPGCMGAMLDVDAARYSETKTVFFNGIRPSDFVLRLLRVSERAVNTRLAEVNGAKNEELVSHAASEHYALHEFHVFPVEYNHFKEEPHHMISLVKVFIRSYVTFRFNNRQDLFRQTQLLKESW